MWKLLLVLVFKLLFLLLQIDVKVFVYNYINKKERWLWKEQIFKKINNLSIRSSIFLHLESTVVTQ